MTLNWYLLFMCMYMKLEGKVISLTGVEEVGPKKMPKQVIVVEEVGVDYPQAVAADFVTDDGVAKLAGIEIGDMVSLEFNMKVNEYNGKTYNSIRGWKITKHESAI